MGILLLADANLLAFLSRLVLARLGAVGPLTGEEVLVAHIPGSGRLTSVGGYAGLTSLASIAYFASAGIDPSWWVL